MRIRWTVLAICFGLAIATMIHAMGRQSTQSNDLRSSQNTSQLMPDYGSEIELVACSLSSARKSSLRNSELVQNITNALSPETHVLILVNDRKAFDYDNANPRVTFIELPESTHLSIWPQDPFLVRQNNHKPQLILPKQFKRGDDHQMGKQLASQLGIQTHQTELLFEGGNIVCGDSIAVIGKDTIIQNVIALRQSESNIVARFEKVLGLPVCVIGEAGQSVGHIDLIVTPLTKNRFLVADTRLGAALAQTAINQNPHQIQEFEKNCEDHFFGAESIQSLSDVEGQTLQKPQVVGMTTKAISHSLDVSDDLDLIASQLADKGFEVHRIPTLFATEDTRGQTNDSKQSDDNEKQKSDHVLSRSTSIKTGHKEESSAQPNRENAREIRYPFLTYNNVLMETRNGQDRVYLPQYGLDSIDREAFKVWEELGFHITSVEGITTSAMYGGSLRCCTKVLLRK